MNKTFKRKLIVIAAKKIYGDPEDTRCRHIWKVLFYLLLFDAPWLKVGQRMNAEDCK